MNKLYAMSEGFLSAKKKTEHSKGVKMDMLKFSVGGEEDCVVHTEELFNKSLLFDMISSSC